MSRRPTSVDSNRATQRSTQDGGKPAKVGAQDEATASAPRTKKPTRWWFVLGGLAILLVLIGLFLPKAIRDYSILKSQQALLTRDYDAALTWLDRASQVAPNDGEVAFMKARTYRKMGKVDDFEEWLGAARLEDYSRDRCRREEWLLAAQRGRFDVAGPHLEELLDDEFEDYAEVMEAFANGYLLSGRPNEAREFIEPWEASFPEDPLPKVLLGMVEWEQGKSDSAVKRFKDALEIQPNFLPAKMALAESLSREGSYDEAMPLYRECLSSENYEVDARNKLAYCLRQSGQLEEAYDLLQEALEINPNSFVAHLEVAKVEEAREDFSAARDALIKALEVQPNDAEAHTVLARVLRSLGEPEQAAAHEAFATEAEQMLEQVPTLVEQLSSESNETETRALRVRIGRILMRYGSEQEGVAWVFTALEVDPEYQPAFAALAEFFERKARSDARYLPMAQQYLEQAQGYQLPPLTGF